MKPLPASTALMSWFETHYYHLLGGCLVCAICSTTFGLATARSTTYTHLTTHAGLVEGEMETTEPAEFTSYE